jgi:hypothetical protein
MKLTQPSLAEIFVVFLNKAVNFSSYLRIEWPNFDQIFKNKSFNVPLHPSKPGLEKTRVFIYKPSPLWVDNHDKTEKKVKRLT